MKIRCMGVLLILVLSEFAFIAYGWFQYCPPTGAVGFAFSGNWFKEEFSLANAGMTLDQPSIGKFFLWTSIVSCLACTIILLLHLLVSADRRIARRCVSAVAALLVIVVLIEFLVPTFLLVQYVLSMGLTIRRCLGLCVCCGIWILLPYAVFWMRRANPTLMKWSRSPLTWAFACSAATPAYYLSLILPPPAWIWSAQGIGFALMCLVPIAQIPCIIWLWAWDKRHATNHGNGETPTTA